jgi:hypothetical protein
VNPAGNKQLTAVAGLVLLAPIAVVVGTVLLGVHTFMSLHVFFGLALIPPVLLKLASTGWRFARYYARSRPYVIEGPPQLAMRLVAPLFVAATVVLFGSGVAMGVLHGHALQLVRSLHGPASVIWLLLLGVHILVYLGRALRGTSAETRGRVARAAAVLAVVVAGLALGMATIPAQHRWVNLRRDHHDRNALGQAAARAASNCSTAKSRSAIDWAADICVRIRAVPRGTTG